MELSRNDLLRLLSVLEGELQSREILIAVLRSEQTKKLLYPNCKIRGNQFPSILPVVSLSNRSEEEEGDADALGAVGATIVPNRSAAVGTSSRLLNTTSINISRDAEENNRLYESSSYGSRITKDPLTALCRDSCLLLDPGGASSVMSMEEVKTRAIYHLGIQQLNHLIEQQQSCRQYFKNMLQDVNERFNEVFQELEEEKRRKETYDRNQVLEQMDIVQKENDSLKQQVSSLTRQLELEKEREKKMILSLLSERKQLIVKLIEEKSKNNELIGIISSNKAKINEMIEGLEEESKRSLQMELDLEKLTHEFKNDTDILKDRLMMSEAKNHDLHQQMDLLRRELDSLKGLPPNHHEPSQTHHQSASSVTSTASILLGEGVRASLVRGSAVGAASSPSSNVTIPVTNHSTSVTIPVHPPKLSIAQNVVPGSSSAPLHPPPSYSSHHHSASSSSTGTIIRPSLMLKQQQQQPINTPAAAFTSQSYNKNVMTTSSIQVTTDDNGVPIAMSQSLDESSLASSTTASTSASAGKIPLVKRLSNPGSRGVPPPVPPNKPVLPTTILKEKSKMITSSIIVGNSKNPSGGSPSSSSLLNKSLTEGTSKSSSSSPGEKNSGSKLFPIFKNQSSSLGRTRSAPSSTTSPSKMERVIVTYNLLLEEVMGHYSRNQMHLPNFLLLLQPPVHLLHRRQPKELKFSVKS